MCGTLRVLKGFYIHYLILSSHNPQAEKRVTVKETKRLRGFSQGHPQNIISYSLWP